MTIMITLDEPLLPANVQDPLCALAACIAPARSCLALRPFDLTLWRVILLGLAAERIVWQANLRLVLRIALDCARQRETDVDDLFQEGCLALREAIRRFNPALGYRLSSFAHELIHRRLANVETGASWIGSTQHYRRIRRQMAAGDEEINSTSLRMALARRVTADALLNLPDPDDPFADVDSRCFRILDLLDNQLGTLLRMRFGIDGPAHSQEEIARHFRVSSSTVSRWERKALDQARLLFEDDEAAAQGLIRLAS